MLESIPKFEHTPESNPDINFTYKNFQVCITEVSVVTIIGSVVKGYNFTITTPPPENKKISSTVPYLYPLAGVKFTTKAVVDLHIASRNVANKIEFEKKFYQKNPIDG